jgi:hypothetical protein
MLAGELRRARLIGELDPRVRTGPPASLLTSPSSWLTAGARLRCTPRGGLRGMPSAQDEFAQGGDACTTMTSQPALCTTPPLVL